MAAEIVGALSSQTDTLSAQMKAIAAEYQKINAIAEQHLQIQKQQTAEAKAQKAVAAENKKAADQVKTLKKSEMDAQKAVIKNQKEQEKNQKLQLANQKKWNKDAWDGVKNVGLAVGAVVGTATALYLAYRSVNEEFRRVNMAATSNAKIMHGNVGELIALQRQFGNWDTYLGMGEGWNEQFFGSLRTDLGLTSENAQKVLHDIRTAALPENLGAEAAASMAVHFVKLNKEFREARQSGIFIRKNAREIREEFNDNVPLQKMLVERMQELGLRTLDAKQANDLLHDVLEKNSKVALPDPEAIKPVWQKFTDFLGGELQKGAREAIKILDPNEYANGDTGPIAVATKAAQIISSAFPPSLMDRLDKQIQLNENKRVQGTVGWNQAQGAIAYATARAKNTASDVADQNWLSSTAQNGVTLDGVMPQQGVAQGEHLKAGLLQGMQGAGDAAGLQFTEEWQMRMQERSPSQVMRKAGRHNAQGLALGHSDEADTVFASIAAPVQAAASTTQNVNATINQTNNITSNGSAGGDLLAAASMFSTQAAQTLMNQLSLAGISVGG